MNDTITNILATKPADVHTVSPTDSVSVAVRTMNFRGVGALPVVDNGRLVGIFTERDVLVRIIDEEKDSSATLVREVMTPDPICVGPDATVADSMLLITENHCRHLPVVHKNELVGLVSIGDLIRWVVRDHNDRLDAMLRAMRVLTTRE